MKRKIISIRNFLIIIIIFSFGSCGKNHPSPQLLLTDRDSISTEMQKVLKEEFKLWYPLCIDTLYGGYFSDVNYKWQLEGEQNKMIVSQARHIWSASNAAMFYEDNTELLKIAEHGFPATVLTEET